MELELNRNSYLIMGILRSKNAFDKIRGLTVNEIQELEMSSKPNTIYKRVNEMETLGFVHEGLRAGKAKTYFLTDIGCDMLPKRKENV